MLSRVLLYETPWTIAYQAPLSMVFPRQEYWSGMPFPSPGVFLTQGLNLDFLHWQVIFISKLPGKPTNSVNRNLAKREGREHPYHQNNFSAFSVNNIFC